MDRLDLWRLVALLLILALCAQVGLHVVSSSPTFDEPYHITRSYVYLKTGDSALLALGGHPPFANLLSVSPLLLRSDVRLPQHEPGWPDAPTFKDLFRVADEFIWRTGNDADGIVLWARLPGMALSVGLALLVFRWAAELSGVRAGLLALLLYAFDPNIIAHSGVVTTDLGATFFIFLSVYCLWWFCRGPTWGRLLLTGIVFGLAQATKFSALSLVPVSVVLLAVCLLDGARQPMDWPFCARGRFAQRPRLQRAWCMIVVCGLIFVIGSAVVWAVYGFELGPLMPREDSHPLLDRYLPVNSLAVKRVAYAIAERIPVAAPAYFSELAWLQRYTRAGHPSYLMGSRGVAGWWFYFPVAFLIKTPIPLLLLVPVALWLSLQRRADWKEEVFLLVPVVLFAASSVVSSIDIGYRNILPVLPFIFVYVSKVASRVLTPLLKAALLVLCAWYVLGTVFVSPHYLAYFNEVIGGPVNGHQYLVDSNLDWGQELKNLKKYVDERGVAEIYLSYFGTADPAYYGIRFQPMPAEPPAPGQAPEYYAISATNLQNVYAPEGAGAHWLAQYAPQDAIGYSMFVYRLP